MLTKKSQYTINYILTSKSSYSELVFTFFFIVSCPPFKKKKKSDQIIGDTVLQNRINK